MDICRGWDEECATDFDPPLAREPDTVRLVVPACMHQY